MIQVPDYTLEEEEPIRSLPKKNDSMNELIIKELKELTINIIINCYQYQYHHPYYAAFIIFSCLIIVTFGFILLYSLKKSFKTFFHKTINRMKIRVSCSQRYCFRLQIDGS